MTFILLLKKEIFSLAIKKANYICCALFASLCAVRYFFASFFFDASRGTSDLRIYFSFMPYVLIALVPALCADKPGADKSNKDEDAADLALPVSELMLTSSRWLSLVVFFAVFALVPCFAVPLCVFLAGDIEAAQIFTGFSGVLLFAAAGFALSLFIMQHTKSKTASIVLSALVLAVSNIAHTIPLYVELAPWLAAWCKAISFAWHFDSSGKGIVALSDIIFYYALIFFFVFMTALSIYKKRFGRPNAVTKKYSALIFGITSLFFVFASRFNIKLDLTHAKTFTPSAYSRSLIGRLDENLRITYYLSSELKNLYPQVNDIAEYLTAFSASSLSSRNTHRVSFLLRDPKNTSGDISATLGEIGINAQQIQLEKKNSLEFVNVYSGIVMEYRGSIQVIPFILSPNGIEYEITRRILNFIHKSQDLVYILCAEEGFDQNEFSYAFEWLETAGFLPVFIEKDDLFALATGDGGAPQSSRPQTSYPLIVFGSSALDLQHTVALDVFMRSGGKVFFAVSNHRADVHGSWSVTPNAYDDVIEYIAGSGVKIGTPLVMDISCFRITLQTDESERDTQYQSINYPLWISLLPQDFSETHILNDSFLPMTLFWANPLEITGEKDANGLRNFVPLLKTSPVAWLMTEDSDHEIPFITNPFMTEKTGSESGTEGTYLLGAVSREKNMIIVGDQYFASDVMVSYTGATANLDFLVNAMLFLLGEDDLLSVRIRSQSVSNRLYKKTAGELYAMRIPILSLCIFFIPFVFALAGFCSSLYARRKIYTDYAS
ncbi:MAG: hypothetical protein Ta2A_22500 [Treponemataceae bacterium]|nr:MAG: hypothetical protein Ta2A_22500 [Treponemataceae bacterium]